MKRYFSALILGLLSLTSQLAHADVIDDAIGNIQQAINDAYNPDSQLDDDRRRLEEDERRLEDDYDRG